MSYITIKSTSGLAYRMKVFLSHSTKDKKFVQRLADELKAEKIEVWRCEVDVEFGNNFVTEIEKGLSEADLTLLFWSPDAAASDWARLEWTSVTEREISESRTRLGLVLVRDCEVPELLRVKHRIDARTRPGKSASQGDRVGQAPSRHAPLSGDKSAKHLSPGSTGRISLAAPRHLRCFTQRWWRSKEGYGPSDID